MNYTQLTVKLLEHLYNAEGGYSDGTRITAEELALLISEDNDTASPRRITLAIEELKGQGLTQGSPIAAEGMSRDDYSYISLDITGPGMRFVESLQAQARLEGRKFAWAWSYVEKAVTLSQLVSLAMQAASKN